VRGSGVGYPPGAMPPGYPTGEMPPGYPAPGMPPGSRPPSSEAGPPPQPGFSRSATGGAEPAPARRAPPPTPARAVPILEAGKGPRPHVRLVVPLNSVPAADLATSLGQLLRAEAEAFPRPAGQNVSIVAEPLGNTLLLGGPADTIEEVKRLVAQLDRPASMVALEVVIANAPRAEAAAAPLRVVARPATMEVLANARLTVLDGNSAQLQLGLREATIVGAAMTPLGQTNNLTYDSMGTNVQITPRVSPDGVVRMDISVESSGRGPREEGMVIFAPKEGEPTRAAAIETLMAQATVSVPAGQTIVLAEGSPKLKSPKQRLVLVTPHVLPMSGP
jgi:type II secretory pathway component GspD/PulD (secretin)